MSVVNVLTLVNGVPRQTSAPALQASATDSGFMSAADKAKLDGVASGATANATDANLRDRSTHTGTQLAATISDFISAADARITAQKGSASGLAPLGSDSKIPSSYLPAIAITDTFVVASQTAMLALTAQTGDIAIRTDQSKSYILQGTDPTLLASWTELLNPGDTSIQTVNGKSGTSVVLTTSDITEATNLYYTQGRFDAAFAAKSTSNLSEGVNLYFTTARAQAAISATAPITFIAGVIAATFSAPIAQTPDQTNTVGTAASFARADHIHNIPTAAPVNTGAANAQGTAATFAKSDHVHNVTLTNSEIGSSTTATTTSTTDVLLTGMTVTPIAGTYLVNFSGTMSSNVNLAVIATSIYVGGVIKANSTNTVLPKPGNQTPTTAASPVFNHGLVTVNGSQAIEIRWNVTSGATATNNVRNFTVVRIG